MADQAAPIRVGPTLPDALRPSYEALQQQAAGHDYGLLVPHLSESARAAAGLPRDGSREGVLDRHAVAAIRAYLLDHPDEVCSLPSDVRTDLSL